MHPSPDVLALLALGEQAGTHAEREHVAGCAECRAEVESLARAVDVGRSADAGDDTLLTPPDRVWEAIRAELNFGQGQGQGARGTSEFSTVTALPRHARAEAVAPTDPAPDPAVPSIGPGTRRRSRLLSVALAAALALVVGVGLGVGLDRLLPLQTVLWTADLQALPEWAGAQGEATVVQDSKGNKTLRIKMTSPKPVDGDRQVWVADRELQGMRSIGFLDDDSQTVLPLPREFTYEQFPIVDVSDEPPADTEPRHSGNSIVRGTLV